MATPQEDGLRALRAFAAKVTAYSDLRTREREAVELVRSSSRGSPKHRERVDVRHALKSQVRAAEGELHRLYPEAQRLAADVGVSLGQATPTND
jgi:hypothetical protein